MAQNTVAAGRAWLYSHNIGRNGAAGMGFSQPVGIAAGKNGLLYATNRATEQNPGGIRITKFDVNQEFLGEFGRAGLAYGSDEPTTFTWLSGVALDGSGNVYVSDEWQCRIAIFDPEGAPIGGWGQKGSEPGQLNGPAGIAFDADDNLWGGQLFRQPRPAIQQRRPIPGRLWQQGGRRRPAGYAQRHHH